MPSEDPEKQWESPVIPSVNPELKKEYQEIFIRKARLWIRTIRDAIRMSALLI
jgi:hypothetical protein